VEYQLLFETYESFNQQTLTIKGWSVTIGLAAIIAIYSQQIGRLGKAALWIASLSTIPFWLMDAYWKSFQNAYLDALKKLEAEPHCGVVNEPTLSLVGLWEQEYDSLDFVGLLYLPSVALPHAIILAIGIYLVLRHPPNPQ
jgi:hypothetical protein